MGNLLFLLIAIVLSAIGIFVVWARHRGPSGMTSGVDAFNEQMRAIAPDHNGPGQRRPDDPAGDPSGPDGPTRGR